MATLLTGPDIEPRKVASRRRPRTMGRGGPCIQKLLAVNCPQCNYCGNSFERNEFPMLRDRKKNRSFTAVMTPLRSARVQTIRRGLWRRFKPFFLKQLNVGSGASLGDPPAGLPANCDQAAMPQEMVWLMVWKICQLAKVQSWIERIISGANQSSRARNVERGII
jgi:hypothetical protein